MSSSTTRPPAVASSNTGLPSGEKTFFERQREALLGEIGVSFDHVLQNINKLNRSLEAVIAVGNEFSSVEALWSQFEGVMAKDTEGEGEGEGEAEAHTEEERQEGSGEEETESGEERGGGTR